MSQTDKTDILDFNYGEFNLIRKEQLNSPGFNPVEFDGFRKEAGLNSFTLIPEQRIERTNAIGIISKSGRYGASLKDLGKKWFAFSKMDIGAAQMLTKLGRLLYG